MDERDVPQEVVDFLLYFARVIDEGITSETHALYEQVWPELTERYFKERSWPDESVVERIVGSDHHIFLVLYKELYYRHVYARAQRGPSLVNRFDSFMNYQELFTAVLTTNGEPLALELPNVWLWDIIDEFVYQFQSYCLYKANPSKRSQDEQEELAAIEMEQKCWSVYPVLNVLYSIVERSQIQEQLRVIKEGGNPDDIADEYGRRSFYFRLGYFALIGLLRTHVLLGDYHQALTTVQHLELDATGLYNTVPSCLVTLHYFVGFSHMMMRNYGEATKIFVNCLLYIQRTKALQAPQTISASGRKSNLQWDVIGKTNEQMYHLLAICLTLQPQRVDDAVMAQLLDRTGDRLTRMANGDIDELRLAFQQGCPKFLSPTAFAFEGANLSKEPLYRQSHAFMEGMAAQMALPILRGYLRLYTSIPTTKLAAFMDVPEDDYDTFLGKLLTFKMIVTELGKEHAHVETGDVDVAPPTDIDFYVDKDMIVIADTKVQRRVGEHFIKHVQKLQQVMQTLKSEPGSGGAPAGDGTGRTTEAPRTNQAHFLHYTRK